jgi:DNA topoisomerase VI subunit B
LLTAVKEAVDNSLDACEKQDHSGDLGPHERWTQSIQSRIQDNGPGIVKSSP